MRLMHSERTLPALIHVLLGKVGFQKANYVNTTRCLLYKVASVLLSLSQMF